MGPGDAIVYHSDGPQDWTPFARYFCFTFYSVEARSLPQVIWRGPDPMPADVLAGLRGRRIWLFSGRPARFEAPPVAPGWREGEVIELRFPDSSEVPRTVRVLEPG